MDQEKRIMIKIGIVDDHAVVREGLKALFSGFVEFRLSLIHI